ncbi:MAG TPA: type II toxin-antitoxin system RelE/ParE family toxin [Urbifossiella sp.]|jgi:plasmid stabilization system protein ParE
MARLEFDRRARAEFRSAYRWYLQAGRDVAAKFVAALDSAIVAIETNPFASAKYDHGTRAFRVKGYPYLIVFQIRSSGRLFGIAIAHVRRQRAYWKRRLP